MSLLHSGLPDSVANSEDLTRFLTSSSQYNSTIVKPAAFLPNPKYKNSSVFRESSDEATIIIRWNSIPKNDRNLHGTGIIKAMDVREVKLEVMAAEPPDAHANIENWPWIPTDLELQKAKQKELASFLAQHAVLKVFDSPY